ncbi:MAG: GGDEF domain-containing protein [Spirochaetes bacterium]|nr:GGDEF domain-containing protein [Spirochaetota bacterium]
MIHDKIGQLSTHPEIIANYDLLERTGVWKELSLFQDEVNLLNELLEEASKLFNIKTVNELIVYVGKKIQDKFIPSYLAFVIQDEFYSEKPNTTCFHKMERIENIIEIESFNPYKKIFSLSPTSITFEAFEVLVDNKQYTDVFLPVQPKVLIPLMGLDGVYGFIVLGKKVLDSEYSKSELKYMDCFINFTSISLQNNIHYRRAILDVKTGLYKHSFFMKRLEEEVAKIKRYQHVISIMMLDIDFFKKINDVYGHMAGDFILYEMAKIIKNAIRIEDPAARFGGEEFIVMLTECKSENAKIVAERIRTNIEESVFHYEDKEIKMTVSIGISEACHQNFHQHSTLIMQADMALYHSKRSGRNQTTLYQDIKDLAENKP